MGCGPLALGQIFSYYRKPTRIPGRNIDWNLILEYPDITITDRPERIEMGAFLLHEIGLFSSAIYGKEVTTTNWFDLTSAMRRLGYLSTSSSTSLGDVITQIAKNGPTLMAAPYAGEIADAGDGHAWVTDGYRTLIEKYEYRDRNKDLISTESKYIHYLHMNWGWGGISNGYFLLQDNIRVKYKENPAKYTSFKEFLYAVNVY